jgi:hypothetical protein
LSTTGRSTEVATLDADWDEKEAVKLLEMQRQQITQLRAQIESAQARVVIAHSFIHIYVHANERVATNRCVVNQYPKNVWHPSTNLLVHLLAVFDNNYCLFHPHIPYHLPLHHTTTRTLHSTINYITIVNLFIELHSALRDIDTSHQNFMDNVRGIT